MPAADPIGAVSLIDRLSGLSAAEAVSRRAEQGPNILPRGKSRSVFAIMVETLKEPMLALLLLGGGAYLLLGDLAEALILLAFASFSVFATVFQESRTEHVLEALRELSAPRAMVVRDGIVTRISGPEVVQGDILVLQQGDRVAADALLLEAIDLEVDESLLTGESVTVGKRAGGPEEDYHSRKPGGDDQPFIFGGTLVTRGSGRALVVATGPRSEIGRIGLSLAALAEEPPRLRTETLRIVRFCGIGAGLVALTVVLLFGSHRGSWIDAILAGIAIGMSLLPEEFPVVLTVFLAMGAWRIAKAGVLTRRTAAIESLGSATVLCTDKTGTLTENHMAIAGLWLPGGETTSIAGDLRLKPAQFHALVDAGALASAPAPVDPMEIAFHQARGDIAGCEATRSGWALAHSYGLSEDLLAMSNIWRPEDGGDDCIVAAKGAPEAIASLCRLAESEHREMMDAVKVMAEKGVRVLGVAKASTVHGSWPASQRDHAFHLVGLVGLADPIRQSVPPAIAECRSAGIRVLMITGDHAVTARAIATQAGIEEGEVLTGGELADLDDAALASRLRTVSVFARVMPDQKLRIVNALKSAGEVVAMTGDGVNDAPSLKAAHIGIAMGKRGTDVAREAAAIVLLDDDFGSIVRSVRLGRRIYDNIRKAMGFIFAVHVPIAGLALLPLLTGLPVLFGPIHIAILEMIIDPVCATVFEAEREEADIMRRPPRDPRERLFTWAGIGWSVIGGGVGFMFLAVIFLLASRYGLAEAQVRGLTFFALIGVIVALILASRSSSASLIQALRGGNPMLRYILAAVAGFSALALLIPSISAVLGFQPLGGIEVAIALATGTVVLIMLEQLKRLSGRIVLPEWLTQP